MMARQGGRRGDRMTSRNRRRLRHGAPGLLSGPGSVIARPGGRGGGRRMDVTAQAQADPADSAANRPVDSAVEPGPDLASMPSLTLSDTQLADLELLLSDSFAPLA